MKKYITIIISILLICSTVIPTFGETNLAKLSENSAKNTYLETMRNYGFEASQLTNQIPVKNGVKYTVNYGSFKENVTIQHLDGITKFTVDDGKVKNEVIIDQFGEVTLDGISINALNPQLLKRGWKSVYKGFQPYGSLSSGSYSSFLAQGKQNIYLGKTLDAITAGALSIILSGTNFFVGIGVSIVGVAATIKQIAMSQNPKTTVLGCKYKTYTHGSSDYKYICDYYSNSACSGNYARVIIYEHFVVI